MDALRLPLLVLRKAVGLAVRVLAVLVPLLLRLPWWLLAGGSVALRRARSLAGSPRRIVRASRDTLSCPRCGVEQPLLDRFRCPVCKAVETTHAWAPCACGTRHPAGYVRCATPGCGEAIRNPLLEGKP